MGKRERRKATTVRSDRLSARLALSVYQTIAKREKLNRSGQKHSHKVINGICSIIAINIRSRAQLIREVEEKKREQSWVNNSTSR